MSCSPFGASIGDAFAIGSFAWNIYQHCKSAPAEFEHISREIASLHTALKEVSDEVQNRHSVLNRFGSKKRLELQKLLRNCGNVLLEVEAILTKRQSLGGSRKKARDRFRFESEEIKGLREKLASHKASLNLFLTTLGIGSLRSIEQQINELVEEVRNGLREISSLTVKEQDDGEIVRSTKLEDELHSHGFSREDIDAHKHGIKAYLQELLERHRLGDARSSDWHTASSLSSLIHHIAGDERLLKETHNVTHTRHPRKVPTVASITSPSRSCHARSPSIGSPMRYSFQSQRNGSEMTGETCVETQEEFDEQGRLRKRKTIASSSSNPSIRTDFEFPAPSRSSYQPSQSSGIQTPDRIPTQEKPLFNRNDAGRASSQASLDTIASPYLMNATDAADEDSPYKSRRSETFQFYQRKQEERQQLRKTGGIRALFDENEALRLEVEYLRNLISQCPRCFGR